MNNIYQTQYKPGQFDPKHTYQSTQANTPTAYSNQNTAPFTHQQNFPTQKAKIPYDPPYNPSHAQSRQQPLGEITNTMRPTTPTQAKTPTQQRQAQPIPPTTLMNSIPSEELAVLLKDANKRLARKLKQKGSLNQEDVYIGKMKWLLAMVKNQRKANKHYLNSFSVNIEKIIEESSFSMNIYLFQDQNKMRKVQRDLAHFLTKLEPQKAILLSYKLFKMHLKQGNLQDTKTQQEIAQKAYIFLIPYISLLEAKDFYVKEKTQKKRSSLMTFQRIKKFLGKPDIVQILQKYPDYKNSPDFKAKFENFLNEKTTLQQAMAVMTLKTQSMIFSSAGISDESVVELPTAPSSQGSLDDLDLVESEMYGRALENAKSIELDERNDNFGMHLSRLGNYSAKQIPSKAIHDSFKAEQERLGGARQFRAELPQNVMRCRDLSSDALSNDSSFSDNETDKELMNDPDLFVSLVKDVRGVTPPRDKLDIPFATRTASRFKCEQEQTLQKPPQTQPYTLPTTVLPQQVNTAPIKTRPSFGKQNSGSKEFMTSDNVQLTADPLRMSRMPEMIRVNSSSVLPSLDKKQETQQQESEHFERKGHARHSIIQKSLAVTKTKQQIVFEKVLSIANDNVSKWDTIVNTPMIKINKIKPEDSPVVLLRAWAVIENFTPKEVFDQIYDTENRAKWDPVTIGLRVVEQIDDNSAIIFFYVKTPFGITERDFVQRRNYAFDYPEPGTIIMSFESCTHPSVPVDKKRVRAETHIAGYIMKPSQTRPGSTDLCIISQLDIKGSIPKAIVNMVAGKAPADWVNKLRKACERSRKGGKF